MLAWLFQGNPKKFRIDEYLHGGYPQWWRVRGSPKVEAIEIGSPALIWRSDAGRGDGGVVAIGTVASDIESKPCLVPHLWDKPPTGSYDSVLLDVTERRLRRTDGMILRWECIAHPLLRLLPVLELPQRDQSTVRIPMDLFSCIEALWRERRKPTGADPAP